MADVAAAECPGCHSRDCMTLEPTGRLRVVPGLLGGSQFKVPAVAEYLLRCAPELGGCGFEISGRVAGDHLIAWPDQGDGRHEGDPP